jgi:hypothetical protein
MAAPRRTTTQRGLGHPHKVRALQLKQRHVEGTECWWCGEPMYLAQGLHADHSHARGAGGLGTLPDRLLHGRCNEQRGDGRNDHQRPALTGQPMATKGTMMADLGIRAMPWP